jgi:hypothetical protein
MDVLTEWKPLGVFSENMEVPLAGVNLWDHVSHWHKLGEADLPHPDYRNQTHRLNVYEVTISGLPQKFAMGEVSAGAYAFYSSAT